MRTKALSVLRAILCYGLLGFVWFGAAPEVRGAPLCAPVVTQPVKTPGTCTVRGEFPEGTVTRTCSLNGMCPLNPDEFQATACTPTTTVTSKTATGFVLKNGVCTNDLAGFSGAALASQALSGLAQTTTQATTRSTENTIVDRRERERQRCPEGMSRVNGNCERTPPSVTEVAPPAPRPRSRR